MPKKININTYIGQKFGHLTITKIWRDTQVKEIKCLALCDYCQQEKEYRFRNLTTGATKSCGCLHKIDLNNLPGQKFNRLLILEAKKEKRNNDSHNYIYVKCKCDCGNIIECRLANLKNNTIQSCGCLHKEISSINLNDLIGKQYDKLVIIDAYKNDENKIRVKAKCECSNIINIPYRSLQKNTNMCKQCKSKEIKNNNLQDLKKLINKQYGKLIIIDAYRNDRSEIRVKAKCECGNIIDTRYRNLAIGKTKSCGKCKQINLNDLIGKKYNKLTIIDAQREKGKIHVKAKCDCGNIKKYYYSCLKNGHTQSCGCINRTANGESITRLYKIYKHIKNRCYNIKDPRYTDWGGRGITICNEWKDNFENFKQWALNNGYNDTLTIDRIDNDGNYEPNNCRWITQKIQNRNKRNNHYITINNETKALVEWCEQYNINYKTVLSRIYRKWDPLKALTMPIKK